MTIHPVSSDLRVASSSSPCPPQDAVQAQDPSVVLATGDLDLATVGRFRGELTDRIGRGHLHLVVDLAAVGFIDSTGLGALVAAHRTLQRRGGTLRLVCRQTQVLRVLSLTGLDTVLEVHDDLTEAVSACVAQTVQPLGMASASSAALSAAPISTAIDSR